VNGSGQADSGRIGQPCLPPLSQTESWQQHRARREKSKRRHWCCLARLSLNNCGTRGNSGVRGKFLERVGSLKKISCYPTDIHHMFFCTRKHWIQRRTCHITHVSVWPIVKVADNRIIIFIGEIFNFVCFFWLAKSDI
jgi:hypothetical protein